MEPLILHIPKKTIVGHCLDMSLVDNRTAELFSGFMPHKAQITQAISQDVHEVMVYDALYFKQFNPNTRFQKWAAVEVDALFEVPEGMHTLSIDEGLYAVFTYKGLPQHFGSFMQSILTEWLPSSGYTLDHRPHINILGASYKHNHPDSEEAVYIPIAPTR